MQGFICWLLEGYKDVSILDDPQMEACIFVVNQEQAFEVFFKWRLFVDEQSQTQCDLGKWWRDQPRWLERGTKQYMV